METKVNIISCVLKEGTGKSSGKPYSFYTGNVYLLGGVVQFTSSVAWKADIARSVSALVTLADSNGSVKVKLEPVVV